MIKTIYSKDKIEEVLVSTIRDYLHPFVFGAKDCTWSEKDGFTIRVSNTIESFPRLYPPVEGYPDDRYNREKLTVDLCVEDCTDDSIFVQVTRVGTMNEWTIYEIEITFRWESKRHEMGMEYLTRIPDILLVYFLNFGWSFDYNETRGEHPDQFNKLWCAVQNNLAYKLRMMKDR